MPVLRLSPEEMAVAIAGMLDEIKENPEESRYLCQTFWNKLWYDISSMDERASEEEVSYAIIVTMALLVVCLLLVDNVRHRTLALDLICVIQEHTSMQDLEQIQRQMNKFVWRMGEHRLKERMEQYWQSDMFLSDAIYEVLHKDGLEQQEIKPGKVTSGLRRNIKRTLPRFSVPCLSYVCLKMKMGKSLQISRS